MPEPAAEQEYRRHERAIHAMLARRHPRLGADERSELYQEAWAGLLSQRARGRSIETVEGYLVGAADKLAAKRLHGPDARRRIAFDPLDGPFAAVADDSSSPEERALAADDARLMRMLLEELDDRERAVIELRLDVGLEPKEIRERLGLTERQYRRIAERAARALLSQLAAFEGGVWARRQRSLLASYALGVASARQRERARRLVRSDPFCRALMSELLAVGRRAAALLPVPAATQTGPRGRAAELLAAARQQLAALSSRAVDATPLAGARPGAAGALVAGCLAAGGGAYCAVEGAPDALRPSHDGERAAGRELPRERWTKAPAPQVAPTAPAVRRAPAAPARAPARSAPPPPPPPAREFEPAAPGPPTPAPAPAPRAGPSEFAP